MQLVVLGLNHKTAPVEIRECFSFSAEQVKKALQHIYEYEVLEECVILSTCNRTEMYAVVDDAREAFPVMRDFLERMSVNPLRSDEHLFYYTEEKAILHLFRVASSLDSLVIGEGQILSQVKTAYSIARDGGTTSTVLNTLFNRAIAVGKKVRTETKIAYNAVSVSYTAVELAKKVFGDLSASNVLILGAGEMSELTARHLVGNGVKTVFVSNRNYQRAAHLAERFQGIAVPFESFMQSAVDADIIITSTGAPHYIIRAWDVAHLMTKRQGRPIVLIDIAVPRDVEPEVGAINGVSLFDIDDLEAVVESNIREREQEARLAEEIIQTELTEVLNKLRYLSFRPVMARLTDKVERIRQREMKRAMAKWPDISADERKVLENMSRMMMRKILRDPMIKINEAAGTGKEQYYLEAISSLFKLDEIGEEPNREKKTCRRYAGQ
ncbi:glutamyl-trna reductase signature [Lucifera butyrica]|uniref:Glutamyl-tRNA reductase n=1 Tax=Lucifera butyrica TaxID=1351585 RepID=A0A498R7Z0_9FIRM|nr:glutamyl-tRNA reductase [Lucifera butyrica]VBB08836.1 glutamyl-trna reductase signature [Lucifera butyrica]